MASTVDSISPLDSLQNIGHLELKGRKESTDGVLNAMLADKIRTYLPALSRLSKSWNLIYSLDQHGISLNTLYAETEAASGVRVSASGFATRTGALVIVKDSDGMLFGVYLGDGLHKGKGYYGSGESFLWKYEESKNVLDVYKWTGKNEYVALCEGEYLSFGGGDGTYGLYIDESLLEGSSAHCPTFENPPLCSSTGPKKGRTVAFDSVGLEVWGIGP
ncbi:oxidation resistance protein 1 [Marasmius crinis-equi]|uniref:Oxidation resistance protein 1 n=1 Tax=Marasmius crinis-equi TaxID=585013 RepID=A0ABR3F194_9AGAR